MNWRTQSVANIVAGDVTADAAAAAAVGIELRRHPLFDWVKTVPGSGRNCYPPYNHHHQNDASPRAVPLDTTVVLVWSKRGR